MTGTPGPYILKVKNKFLLNDYIENHAPVLSKLIDEFNDLYNNLWKYYYEINDEVRNIIYEKTNLPIYTWNKVKFGNFPKKENHVTTNLQFELIQKLGLYNYPYLKDRDHFSYSVRLKNGMYECISEEYVPYKIYIRVQEQGLSKEEFSIWIDNVISLIISDIKKSNKIRKFSNSYSLIMDKYRFKRIELLDFFGK